MKLYVGNLAYSVTEDDLRRIFAAYGEVSSAAIITDKYTGQSKGFGFIEMPSQAQAEEAIKGLDGNPLKGRNIKVNEARPKEDRPKPRQRY